MIEDNEKIETVEIEENDPTEQAIEEFFKGITPGMTVTISRILPAQYKGVLETRTVTDADEPIDLNYLINTWGGHQLRLRFRRPNGTYAKHVDLDLFSYEPLVLGRPLKRPFISPHIAGDDLESTAIVQAAIPPPPPPPQNDLMSGIVPLITAMQAMRQGEIEMISKLIPRQSENPQTVTQLAELLGIMVKMNSFFGQSAPQAPAATGGDEDQMIMGLIGKAIDAFGAVQGGGNKVTKLTPPPRTVPIQNIRPVKSLEDQLSELEPETILSTFQKVLSQLPPEKQEKAMDQLLDGLESLGMIGGDEETENDGETEDSSPENSRGAV